MVKKLLTGITLLLVLSLALFAGCSAQQKAPVVETDEKTVAPVTATSEPLTTVVNTDVINQSIVNDVEIGELI